MLLLLSFVLVLLAAVTLIPGGAGGQAEREFCKIECIEHQARPWQGSGI